MGMFLLKERMNKYLNKSTELDLAKNREKN